ncbi:MAG: 30S ribosomal protein S15 [Candidatus Lokiarchaeota archaeon]|nr:30S ribosomal protein S15 [Candidatus Lokiarchaeota archaeon]
MARIHASRHGSAGSTRPAIKASPEWLTYSQREVEDLVISLGREGYMPANIGLILRDSYGIPLVKTITGKKITAILKENNMLINPLPEDLTNLIRKALLLRTHMENNRKDMHNKRALQCTESKVYRLVKYYKGTGVLASTFRYKPEEMKGLVSR